MNKRELEKRVEELERRLGDLERRPMPVQYVPYYPIQPAIQPMPQWNPVLPYQVTCDASGL